MAEPEPAKKVLLLASERWMSTGRLALALQSFGCGVELMARRDHPALRAGIVPRTHRYSVLRPVESILRAVLAARPDVVLAADELATMHLDELRAAAELSEAADSQAVRAILAASGLHADTLQLGRSRLDLMRLAERLGVAVPETAPVPVEADLEAVIRSLGLPLALKADATFGGRGVRLVSNLDEARRAWGTLHRSSTLYAALRRGMVWGEWGYVREWSRAVTRAVAAQRLVLGPERTAMAFSRDGELKAVVCMEVLQVAEDLGPSSVLRIVDSPVMEDAIRKVARGANVSGFCGFDFMLDTATGTPLLIEMNLRPTQLVHLALGPGRDLIAAYLRGMLGMPIADRPAVTEGNLIALFPQEVLRDASSEWLHTAYHDVPWESPELVRAGFKRTPALITNDPRWPGARPH